MAGGSRGVGPYQHRVAVLKLAVGRERVVGLTHLVTLETHLQLIRGLPGMGLRSAVHPNQAVRDRVEDDSLLDNVATGVGLLPHVMQ